MDNLTLKEEMQILGAAKLAGGNAPENLDTQRTREFVHAKLHAGQPARRTIFRSPVTYVAFAVAACLIAVLMIFNPDSESGLEVMQQERMHAVADSLDAANDSLDVNVPETFEITSIDE